MTWSPFFTEVTPGTDIDHDAGALVTEDRRKQTLRVGARPGEFVGVADAGRLDFDEDFAGLRPFELYVDNFQRFAGTEGYSRTHIHWESSLPVLF